MLSVTIYSKERVSQVATSFLGRFTNSQKQLSALSCLCVCLCGTTQLPLGEFSWNLTNEIFKKCVEKIQVSLKCDNNSGTLHEDRYIIMTIFCSILLKIKSVASDKSRGDNQNINIHFHSITFFENKVVYEIMWKNMV